MVATFTLFVEADAKCQPGSIRPVGILNRTHLFSRMELCDDDRVWRKIRAGGWDEKDTRVACRIL